MYEYIQSNTFQLDVWFVRPARCMFSWGCGSQAANPRKGLMQSVFTGSVFMQATDVFLTSVMRKTATIQRLKAQGKS